MERIIRTWLESRRMAPMGFLVDVQPFVFPEERRYFVAEHEGAIVGFLVAVPIFARQGWFFEDFLRLRDAPNGTNELLFDAAIGQVAAEGGQLVTLGLSPLAGDVSPWLVAARAWLRGLYDFDGLRQFKARLAPDGWEPVHLAWPDGHSGIVALADALAAFTMRGGAARASFVRFGLQTALGSPEFATVLLATLLVPWTLLLTLSGGAWFPEAWVRWAWVSFDCVLIVGLLSLARSWRRWLARSLAVAITLDALVTVMEVALFNLPRATRVSTWVVLVLACAGPSVAATFLWLALRRARVV
jgi:phosphatidylglycerol lysyltransferase